MYTQEDAHIAIIELEEKIDSYSRLSKWMRGLDLNRFTTLAIYAVDKLSNAYGMQVNLPAHHWELLNAVVDATVAECEQKMAYIKANTKLY